MCLNFVVVVVMLHDVQVVLCLCVCVCVFSFIDTEETVVVKGWVVLFFFSI